MRISLVGMPASGKSTLGKSLATQLGLPFIDLDEYITQCEGVGIAEIFRHMGEAYFRQQEAQYLREVLSREAFVLATGGGAPCFWNNMHILNTHTTTIWLGTKLDTLVQRMWRNPSRPLFQQASPEQLRQQLLQTLLQRQAFYAQARIWRREY